MSKLSIVLLLAALFSGIRSIHSEMEIIDGGGTEESFGNCGTILTTVQMSQKQLDKLEYTVRSITPNLKDNIELSLKLVEKLTHFIESKFVEVDKKMDRMEWKLTTIEDKISQYTSHIDSEINSMESTITQALNVSDTSNNTNTSTKIKDKNITTLNVSGRLSEINETLQNLSRLDGVFKSTTEHARTDVPTEVKKPAPSKTCDRSQQEECCTAAVVGYNNYTQYIEMSTRGRHTVVNMTSAGLQEYTMYFAVRGEYLGLLLSSTSNYNDLYYSIGFHNVSGGHIWMFERLTVSERKVRDLKTTNIISSDHYTYYYVRISGDTLKVGRRGEPPLITHTSTELRRLKYFTFAWWYSEGKALYDCTAE